MSNNVKFINQQEVALLKNHVQKRISLNSKNIPGGASKANKSFRGKIDKNKDSKQPLGVINENDVNQGNIKPTNQKNKLTKMKSMDKINNQNQSKQISIFNMEKNSKNIKNETNTINKKNIH